MQALSSLGTVQSVVADTAFRAPQSRSPATGADAAAVVSGADAVQTASAQEAKSETAKVKESIDKVNSMVKSMGRDLEFSVDNETNISVVKVMDTQTNEVIRQIPSEEVVQIAKALDQLQGLLIKDKA